MSKNETKHWWECTDKLCPNKEASKTDEEAHNWIDSQDKADADNYKETFEECVEDNKDFLVNGTGNLNYKTDADDETKCDKITTYYVYCADCELVDTSKTFEYTELVEHELSDWYRNAESHWKQCTHFPSCTYTKETVSHAYDDNEDAICNTCGFDRTHPHELKREDKEDATCTTAGHETYYKCTDENCGLLYADPFGLVKIDNINDTIIPAKGHTLGDYSHNENEHWQACGFFSKTKCAIACIR